MQIPRLFTLVAVVLCLGLLACGRSEQTQAPSPAPSPAPPPMAAPVAPAPFRVGAIDLGTAIGADKRVSTPADAFAPTDTIYASVATEGAAPTVTLTARWSYEDGQLVEESSETIAPTGPAVTEFHIAKPDGWPTGRYKIEIIADGRPAGAREFEVR
jgi:hypothetical protein